MADCIPLYKYCNYINKYKKNILIKTSTNFANKLQIQIKEKPYFQFRTYEKNEILFPKCLLDQP